MAKITGQVTIDGRRQVGEGIDTSDVVLLDASGAELRTWWADPTFEFRDLPAGTSFLLFRDGGGDEPSGIVPEYDKDLSTLAGATPITVKKGGAVTRLVADLVTKP